MGELIAALVEAVASFFAALAEGLPAILECLYYIVAASITIVAYVVSPSYRWKKRREWAEHPKGKYWDLGISGICLAALIGVAAWLAIPSPKPTYSEVKWWKPQRMRMSASESIVPKLMGLPMKV